MTEEPEATIAAAVDELTELLIDRVLPVAQRYRVALADRLGLGLPELLCVDLLRRLGPLPAGAVAERVDLTRSTTSKMLRRLEADGHVVREPDPGHRQGQVVRLVPIPTVIASSTRSGARCARRWAARCLPSGCTGTRRSRSPPGCSSTSRTACSWP